MVCFGHQVLLRRGHAQSERLTVPSYSDQARDEREKSGRRREHISEAKLLADQPRLHSRRPDIPSEPQRHVWPDEVVVAAQDLELAGKALALDAPPKPKSGIAESWRKL